MILPGMIPYSSLPPAARSGQKSPAFNKRRFFKRTGRTLASAPPNIPGRRRIRLAPDAGFRPQGPRLPDFRRGEDARAGRKRKRPRL